MAELTDETKREIVRLLACYVTPAEVVAGLAEDGIDITVRQVGAYDPSRSYFEAGEWARTLFEETRKTYIEEVSSVPIANQGFRLNQLNLMADRAYRAGAFKLAAEIYEQAAKEVGGVLTNQRNLTVEGRGRARDLSAEERREALFNMIDDRLSQLSAGEGTAIQ